MNQLEIASAWKAVSEYARLQARMWIDPDTADAMPDVWDEWCNANLTEQEQALASEMVEALKIPVPSPR